MADPERSTAVENLEKVFLSKVERASANGDPLEITKEDARVIRQALIESGANFELRGVERESLVSASQFRSRVSLDEEGNVTGVQVYDRSAPKGERWKDFSVDTLIDDSFFSDEEDGQVQMVDRTLGVMAVLGKQRFINFVVWSYQEAVEKEYEGKIGGKEGTEGRGIMQVAGKLLAIASLDPEVEGYNEKLRELNMDINKAWWKGLRKTRKDQIVDIDKKFAEAGVPVPATTTASLPPSSLSEIFRRLVSR